MDIELHPSVGTTFAPHSRRKWWQNWRQFFFPTPQYGNVFCSPKFLRLLVKRTNICYV